METVALLLVIAAITVAFVWLHRELADDDRSAEEAAEQPSQPPQPTTIRNEVLAEETATAKPVPRYVLPAAAGTDDLPPVALPAAAATLAKSPTETEAEATDAPPLTPPEGPPSAALMRGMAVTLITGGLALLVMAQITSRALPPDTRISVFLLTLLGGLAFLLGGRTAVSGDLPTWLARPLGRAAAFLRVTPAQITLLALALAFAWLARLAAGNGLLAFQPVISMLAWVIAIAFAVAGSVAPSTRSATAPRAFDRKDVFIMSILFIGALLLRAVATAQFPNTFSGDEGSAALFASEILDGLVTNAFTTGWFSFPSLYFTIQSAAIGLGGQTVEAVRITSAIGGALSVVALYALARVMFDRTTAILAAAYLMAAHYHIHMSRIALNNVWDGLFGTLAIFGLWWGWQSGRRGAFILCGLALGLGQYFYVAIRVLPLLFLIWAAVAFWRQRAQFRERLPGLVVAAYIALIVFLPLGLYFAGAPDEFQAPLNRVTIFGDWLERELANTDRTTADIVLDQAVAGVMGFTHEPLRLLYNPGSPLLLAGAATLFLLGVLLSLFTFDLRTLLLLLPLASAIVANAISQDSPASQRYVMAMPLVAIFIALPLAQLVEWLGGLWPRYRPAVLAAVVGVMALVMAIDLNYYFNDIYDTYVLGGENTLVATEIGTYLQAQDPPDQDVYFFGFPRMGYRSLSTIPYLAPQMDGEDIVDPLDGLPDWQIEGPSLFIFLPERLGELETVRFAFPDGRYEEFLGDDGRLLFAVYSR